MPTPLIPPDPIVVTCKALFRIMQQQGYSVRKSVRDYVNALAPNEWFETSYLTRLKSDVTIAVRDLCKSDPQVALQFVTQLTYAFEPGALMVQRELASAFFSAFNHPDVWQSADVHDDVCYAFAFFMLTEGYFPQRTDEIESIITQVLGQPFAFSGNMALYTEQFAIAMFGPVWQALYMQDGLDDNAYIDLILHQRPPMLGRTERTGRAVDIPDLTGPA